MCFLPGTMLAHLSLPRVRSNPACSERRPTRTTHDRGVLCGRPPQGIPRTSLSVCPYLPRSLALVSSRVPSRQAFAPPRASLLYPLSGFEWLSLGRTSCRPPCGYRFRWLSGIGVVRSTCSFPEKKPSALGFPTGNRISPHPECASRFARTMKPKAHRRYSSVVWRRCVGCIHSNRGVKV